MQPAASAGATFIANIIVGMSKTEGHQGQQESQLRNTAYLICVRTPRNDLSPEMSAIIRDIAQAYRLQNIKVIENEQL